MLVYETQRRVFPESGLGHNRTTLLNHRLTFFMRSQSCTLLRQQFLETRVPGAPH